MYLNHFFVTFTDHEGLNLLFIIMLLAYSTPLRRHAIIKSAAKFLVRSQSIDEETGRMRWCRKAPSDKPSAVDVGKTPLDTLSARAARGHPASCARLFRLFNSNSYGIGLALIHCFR